MVVGAGVEITKKVVSSKRKSEIKRKKRYRKMVFEDERGTSRENKQHKGSRGDRGL